MDENPYKAPAASEESSAVKRDAQLSQHSKELATLIAIIAVLVGLLLFGLDPDSRHRESWRKAEKAVPED
jgi:hypothetical protein